MFKLLESLSARVRRGGSIAWACAEAGAGSGAASGSYGDAVAAFDAVIQASLRHIAQK